jgi:serine/threonine-protein kinase
MSSLVFEKYEILQRLARGGMGEVYLARQEVAGFERLVILKNLLGELADQDGFVEQFLNEARVTAALNHPNIVSIFEVGAWQGNYFIALEYIDGVDLSRLRKVAGANNVGLPFALSAKLVHDTALGLAYAHKAAGPDGTPLNIVHRDISPHNIMVRRDGVVKVVDFGIAKSSSQMGQTATGVLKGKIQYMPPEQVRGEKLDGRTDVYSLGVVFWELCTGKPLFRGANEFNTLQRVLNQPVPKPSEVVDGVPPEIDDVVMGMLERDVEKRTPSADAVARQLARYMEKATRQFNQSDVAHFVEAMVGDDLSTRTHQLQRKDVGDFVIDLSSDGKAGESSETQPTKELLTPGPEPGAPRRGGFALAAAASLLLVGGLAAALLLTRDRDVAPIAEEPVLPAAADALLDLVTTPPKAEVRLEGELLGETPLKTRAVPVDQDVTLTISLEGHVTREVDLKLAGGAERQLELLLQPLAKKPPAATPAKKTRARKTRTRRPASDAKPKVAEEGYLSISVKPWAHVSIDGVKRGETPIYKMRLPAGKHVVRLRNPGIKLDTTKRITIKSGKTSKIVID